MITLWPECNEVAAWFRSKRLNQRERRREQAEQSDGNKFTLGLALVCILRSIAACLPALMGNGRLIAKFPLRGCGHPSHAIIYTDMHVLTHPDTVIYLCVHTVVTRTGAF